MNKLIKTPSFELAVYIKGSLKAKKLALVLPGRLDTKDYPHMRSHVDFLASKGYLACSFDPPGTWESPGSIEIYTMTNYLKAINELIEYFGNKPTVIMGHSRGGTMAMLAGTENIHATHIISVMSRPQVSTVGIDEKAKGNFVISRRDVPSGGEIEFKLPFSYFEDAARYDLTDALSKCIKPKLYVFGKKDKIITSDMVKDTFKKSAEPKELYELDSDHNYRYHSELIDEVNKVIGKFLDKRF